MNKNGMNWCRKDLRLAIYLRDGMACMYCAATLEDGATLTLDHIICREVGGGNGAENVVTACHRCNSVRANRTITAFATATAGYLNHGITADAILTAVAEHTAQPIAPFRDEAKAILARRPTWQAALDAAAA